MSFNFNDLKELQEAYFELKRENERLELQQDFLIRTLKIAKDTLHDINPGRLTTPVKRKRAHTLDLLRERLRLVGALGEERV